MPHSISLNGRWSFVPGSDPHQSAVDIDVPGLWEAAGHVDLDGEAWYRRTFDLDEIEGRWTLIFGAVMDESEVFVNGVRVGAHEGAFTPFALEVTEAIRVGTNHLDVRVRDIERSAPDHLTTAHGKQGWMNHVFPSPPSMYMTYGGIWQPVFLKRHGDVRIVDQWINSNPHDLNVGIELNGIPGVAADVELTLLGRRIVRHLTFDDANETLTIELGPVEARHWSPEAPVLHDSEVVVSSDAYQSDVIRSRFGLRVVAFDRDGLLLNGSRVKIKSALVQGFRADTLYAEGSRDEIAAEVLAAKDAGFNMLRLHIKAFDPRYLDVCDELGMLLHCDIPVAEPVAHHLLAYDGPIAAAAARAATEQVRRDRNHPSIVLWSAMNELGAEALDVRKSTGYEGFARRLYETISAADPTRPIIENDWIEPDPGEVFCSPVLTAHWYGRLSADYLETLARKTEHWAGEDRPLFVSEFGDWGLPQLGDNGTEFWAYGSQLAAAIEAAGWTDDVESFVEGTQRYQGIADRLQIELFRSTPGVIGWCLTELTDVPQEFNGLLDIERNPKRAAIVEIARATEPVLPVMRRTSWTIAAGATLDGQVVIVNDGPALAECWVRLRVGTRVVNVAVGRIEAASISAPIPVRFDLAHDTGTCEFEIAVLDGADRCGANSYPLHVVNVTHGLGCLSPIGDDALDRALLGLGAESTTDDDALLVIGESCLDPRTTKIVDQRLRSGGAVLILAQPVDAAELPFPGELAELATEWGSTPFLFTTGAGLPCLPQRTVLTTELLEATPTAAWTSFDDSELERETLVGVFKPHPGELMGTIVGRLWAHGGSLTLCQLPLSRAAAAGDPAALALLGDVITYAQAPSEVS